MEIGSRLKTWRLKRGLTIAELVKIIDVSQGSISDFENGNSLPCYETLARYRFFFPDERMSRIIFG